MPKILSFVSQKGGVGKTTCSVNLAGAFAVGECKVLLIDLDPQSSVRYSFGFKEQPKYGTKEFLLSPNIETGDIVKPSNALKNLDIVFSNIDFVTNNREVGDFVNADDHLEVVIRNRAKEYDLVVLDSPAVVGKLTLNALYSSDIILTPLQCEKLSAKSLVKFLRSFRDFQQTVKDKDIKLSGVLLTMFEHDNKIHQFTAKQLYSSLSSAIFETIIPRHSDFQESSAMGQNIFTFNPNSPAAVAFVRLKKELLNRCDLEL